MIKDMTDRVRVLVDRALSSERGDRYRPVKILRQVLGTANDVAGRPFCSEEELQRRRARLCVIARGELKPRGPVFWWTKPARCPG